MNAYTSRFGSGFEQYEDRITPSRYMGLVDLPATPDIKVEAVAPAKTDAADASRPTRAEAPIKIAVQSDTKSDEGSTRNADRPTRAEAPIKITVDAGTKDDGGSTRARGEGPVKSTPQGEAMATIAMHSVKVG